jgi:hypothetical protein
VRILRIEVVQNHWNQRVGVVNLILTGGGAVITPPPPPPPPPPVEPPPPADTTPPANPPTGGDDPPAQLPAPNIAFTAEAVENGVRLEWTPIPGALGYYVYRSTTSGVQGTSITDFALTSTTQVDFSVRVSTNYYYTLRPLYREGGVGIAEQLGDPIRAVPYPVRTFDEFRNLPGVTGRTQNYLVMQLDNPVMTVNGVPQPVDPDPANPANPAGRGTTPVMIGARTMVPIRAVVEAMGGEVIWGGDQPDDGDPLRMSRTTLRYGGNTVVTWNNMLYMDVNGVRQEIDAAPQLVERFQRTMVPVRFAAEYLGCAVTWVNSKREIIITYFTDGVPELPSAPPVPGLPPVTVPNPPTDPNPPPVTATISLDKTAYAAREAITVTVTGATQAMTSNAWVGVYSTGAAHSDWTTHSSWQYIRSSGSSAITLNAPSAAGNYEVRFYRNGSASEAAWVMSVPFTVGAVITTPARAEILLDKTSYIPGETVVATVTIPADLVTTSSWVGVYSVGTTLHTNYNSWAWSTSAGINTANLTAPSTAGSYEVRLYNASAPSDESFVTRSASFTVVAAAVPGPGPSPDPGPTSGPTPAPSGWTVDTIAAVPSALDDIHFYSYDNADNIYYYDSGSNKVFRLNINTKTTTEIFDLSTLSINDGRIIGRNFSFKSLFWDTHPGRNRLLIIGEYSDFNRNPGVSWSDEPNRYVYGVADGAATILTNNISSINLKIAGVFNNGNYIAANWTGGSARFLNSTTWADTNIGQSITSGIEQIGSDVYFASSGQLHKYDFSAATNVVQIGSVAGIRNGKVFHLRSNELWINRVDGTLADNIKRADVQVSDGLQFTFSNSAWGSDNPKHPRFMVTASEGLIFYDISARAFRIIQNS